MKCISVVVVLSHHFVPLQLLPTLAHHRWNNAPPIGVTGRAEQNHHISCSSINNDKEHGEIYSLVVVNESPNVHRNQHQHSKLMLLCCTNVQSQLLVPVPAPIPAIQFRSCRRDRLSAVCNNNFSSLVDADYNFCIRAPPATTSSSSHGNLGYFDPELLVNDDDEWGDDDDDQDRGKAA